MLEKLRKFSNSILAKIFLFLVAIPFVFWGMGDLFRGGNTKTIVKIGNEKISAKQFINYINKYSNPNRKIDEIYIQQLLSTFIGQKLIEQEVKNYNIILSDRSLAKILKNTEKFKRDNEFSRTLYEKFLIEKGLSTVFYEENISKHELKNQLLNFIGGGISPSFFSINNEYNKINQKRKIELINLNNVLKLKLNFSDENITSYFNKNKELYQITYRSIRYIELTPETLTGTNEYNDIFFNKLDQIDDLIVEGKNLEYLSREFNFENLIELEFDSFGKNKKQNKIKDISSNLISKVFTINNSEPTILLENENKYFVIELLKTENVQRNVNENDLRKQILSELENKTKRAFISELINKINNNKFKREDFLKLSKDNQIEIKKIDINNQNDNKILKKEIVNQIYLYPPKKVIIVNDIGLVENYLVYIDEINNVSLNINDKEYEKYEKISKMKIINDLYNTYDSYLNVKYKVQINNKVLQNIKNYF